MPPSRPAAAKMEHVLKRIEGCNLQWSELNTQINIADSDIYAVEAKISVIEENVNKLSAEPRNERYKELRADVEAERKEKEQLRKDKEQLRNLQLANRAEIQKLTELLEQHLQMEQPKTGGQFSLCLTILFSFV
jgi:hypothetical protein